MVCHCQGNQAQLGTQPIIIPYAVAVSSASGGIAQLEKALIMLATYLYNTQPDCTLLVITRTDTLQGLAYHCVKQSNSSHAGLRV